MGSTQDMMTMYGVSVLLLPLLSLTVASPVTTQSDLDVPDPELVDPEQKGLLLPLLGLYGLYSLYEHLMGSTPPTSGVTTPAPGVTTPTPDTTTKKSGLFGWWPNNGGFLGFGLFGKTTETAATTTETVTTTTATTTTTTTAPPTTTKCGGLIGGGLLFC